jgi:hypothetical protein
MNCKHVRLIKDSLSLSLWQGKEQIPIKDVAHIVGVNMVATCSQVLNILSFLKNFAGSQTANKLDLCSSLIEDVLEDEEDGPLIAKLQFIAEQIRLLRKRPYQRRYSPKFLATCVLWENTSPNLYRQMAEEDLITLPSFK